MSNMSRDPYMQHLEDSLRRDFERLDANYHDVEVEDKLPIPSFPYNYYAGFTIINRQFHDGFPRFH